MSRDISERERQQRIQVAQRGGSWSGHREILWTKELSKISKELSKTISAIMSMYKGVKLGAIEKASKAANKMFKSLTDAINPLHAFDNIFQSFTDTVGGFVTGANVGNIKRIAETLFSEETIDNIEKLAGETSILGEGIAAFVEVLAGFLGWVVNDLPVLSGGIADFINEFTFEGFWEDLIRISGEAQRQAIEDERTESIRRYQELSRERIRMGLYVPPPREEGSFADRLENLGGLIDQTIEDIVQREEGSIIDRLEFLQHGGIITSPTLGLLGEKETEVVFPLTELNRFIKGTARTDPEILIELEENRRINSLILRCIKEGY